MPRGPRIVIPEVPHHITQRGNRRDNIFFTDADRLRYLDLLGQYARKHDLQIFAYSLMTNHVHLVATPRTKTALADVLKPAHMRYTQHVNWAHGLIGHLWQNRPFSCPLDEIHFWVAVRYVEKNPVRAGLVARAEDYLWSSAAAHCGLRKDPLISGDLEKSGFCDNWSAWLAEGDDVEELKLLRRSTCCGVPLGNQDFVARIEGLFSRMLRPRSPGRPRRLR
jgi:putative transposase